jgi:hypothetical protein
MWNAAAAANDDDEKNIFCIIHYLQNDVIMS